MKIYFISYADEKYYQIQAERNKELADLKYFDDILTFTRKWLIGTEFYKENKELLDKKIGGGYWLWKPFVILQTMDAITPDDTILYLDCGDIIIGKKEEFKECISDLMEDQDIVLSPGMYPNGEWTKNECFIKMGCEEEGYKKTIQLEAGIILIKKTMEMRDLLEEWLWYCKNSEIIDDNTKDKRPEFIAHRHDQSILTNLSIKYNLFRSNHLRKFILCNKKDIK